MPIESFEGGCLEKELETWKDQPASFIEELQSGTPFV